MSFDLRRQCQGLALSGALSENLRRIDGMEVDMAPNVVVRSVSGQRFTQEVEAGRHKLLADEPESHGGSDRGPGPYEYLLAALGT